MQPPLGVGAGGVGGVGAGGVGAGGVGDGPEHPRETWSASWLQRFGVCRHHKVVRMSDAAAAQLLASKYETSVPKPQMEPIWNVISTMTFCTLQQMESKLDTHLRPSADASE